MARQTLRDLFDQRDPIGRLLLVQVLMLAGDTLVTISLAGSLFFSISPDEAKGKVILYLVLTLGPFAVVSPLLGPMIDRSKGARRAMVVLSAVGRAVICPLMARDIHSLLLFPEAFVILILSKLYLVTRGALVPEMVAMSTRTFPDAAPGGADSRPAGTGAAGEALAHRGPSDPAGEPGHRARVPVEYATLNARLTLVGTLAGFVASVPGVILLKTAGSPAVLVFAVFVFAAAAVAGSRLPLLARRRGVRRGPPDHQPWVAPADPDLTALQPIAHPEVLFGLTTMSLIRGLAGFLVFMLAFGLRREHAALAWYGLALGASGVGAVFGLSLVGRLRHRLHEQQILLGSIWLIALAALGAAMWGMLPAQVFLAAVVGLAGSLAQPSFDAMTQRYVPAPAQGRAFARFATRQQLVWCVGALVPVVIALPFVAGDIVMAAVGGVGGIFYVTSRRALQHRALPRHHDDR